MTWQDVLPTHPPLQLLCQAAVEICSLCEVLALLGVHCSFVFYFGGLFFLGRGDRQGSEWEQNKISQVFCEVEPAFFLRTVVVVCSAEQRGLPVWIRAMLLPTSGFELS